MYRFFWGSVYVFCKLSFAKRMTYIGLALYSKRCQFVSSRTIILKGKRNAYLI